MQTRIPDIKPGIEFLKYYQIVGGLIGIGITIFILKDLPSFSGLALFIFLIGIGLYSYSIYCGLLLFKNIKKGLAFSRINQILQSISFAILGYSFQYISGLYLIVGIDFTQAIGLRFNIGFSSWQIEVNSGSNDLAVNFNLIATLLITIIEKLLKRIRLKEHNEIISALGEPVKEGE